MAGRLHHRPMQGDEVRARRLAQGKHTVSGALWRAEPAFALVINGHTILLPHPEEVCEKVPVCRRHRHQGTVAIRLSHVRKQNALSKAPPRPSGFHTKRPDVNGRVRARGCPASRLRCWLSLPDDATFSRKNRQGKSNPPLTWIFRSPLESSTERRVGAPGLQQSGFSACRPGAPTRHPRCEISGLTPPRRGTDRTRTNACSPPGRGRGWVGSWRASRGACFPQARIAPVHHDNRTR